MMQSNFKPESGTIGTHGGATHQGEGNPSNLGVSAPVPQRLFAIGETSARLLSFCVELDMLVEELDLTVKDITNDDSHMERIAMDVSKIKDIILTKFLVPNIAMSLGSTENLHADTVVV